MAGEAAAAARDERRDPLGAARRPRPVHRRRRGAAPPELRGRPVVVGGDGDPTKRGVVAHGVVRGARVRRPLGHPAADRAAASCPDAVFLPVDRPAYEAASARGDGRRCGRSTRCVEVLGWDEAFLGVDDRRPGGAGPAGSRTGSATRPASTARSASARTSCRPRSRPGSASRPASSGSPTPAWFAVLGDRPTDALWGIGAKTARRLAALGIGTVADLAGTDPRDLAAHFGPMIGPWLVQTARGLSPAPVDAAPYVPRSHGQEITFQRDITDWDEVRNEVARLARQVAADIAGGERPARRVVVKVRYAPFITQTHGHPLPTAASTPRRSSRPPSPRWTSSGRAARSGCWASAPNSPADPGHGRPPPSVLPGRLPVVQTAHFQDLGAERLEPGQQAIQRGLVGKDAVKHGPDRLHAGVELLEVEQGLRWERPRHADLVMMRGSQGQAPSVLGRRTFCCLPCRASGRREPPMVGDSSPG